MHWGRIAFQGVQSVQGESDTLIDQTLDSVREHFGMAIAYVSQFQDDHIVFRNISAPGLEHLAQPGSTWPMDRTYCRHVLAGDLPALIPDTSKVEFAMGLDVTAEIPIGSHLSLPITLPDGTVYGMFCCLSPEPKPELNDRDLEVMRMFAGLAAEHVRLRHLDEAAARTGRQRVQDLLDRRAFDIVFQPIYQFATGSLSGFEALCRFRLDPYLPPDILFEQARSAGLQQPLEMAVMEKALEAVDDLPPGTRLSVNASPDTLASGALRPVFAKSDPSRITLEITEHAAIGDLERLVDAAQAIRSQGTLIAIDDVGAGYSGLQQILRIRPDVLKLDMSLVRDIHCDPARRSLATALIHFAGETGALVTAEGIETSAEWRVLRQLGFTYGQGWLMGRPGPIDEAPRTVLV